MRNLSILLLLSFLAIACVSPRVYVDKSVDFHRYKTFAYIKKGIAEKPIDPDFKKIIVSETDAALIRTPLKKNALQPDLLITIDANIHKRYDVYPGPYRKAYGKKSYEGYVSISMFDPVLNKDVWKGGFNIRFANKRELARTMHDKLAKLFKNFPPGTHHR
jgi:hypothetical protein